MANSSTWYHFILTYDASTGAWAAYADGSTTAIDSGTQAADATNMDGILTIGGRTDNSSEFITGAIDMVGVWNRVLTTQEIQDEFDAFASTADPAINQNQGGGNPPTTGSFRIAYLNGSVAKVYINGSLTRGVYSPPEQDLEAPTVPTSLTNTAQTQTSLTYTWVASTDNEAVTGYEYELDDSGSPVDVGNVLTATPSGLTASTAYNFKVRAYDANNNKSAYTANVQGTTSAAPATTQVTVAGTPVYSSTGGMPLSVSWPSTVAAGKLAILVMSVGGETGQTINTPAGWTEIAKTYEEAGNRQYAALFWKVTDGTEGGTSTSVSASGFIGSSSNGSIIVFNDAETTGTPYYGLNVLSGQYSPTATVGDLVGTEDHGYALLMVTVDDAEGNGSIPDAFPSGYTGIVNGETTVGSDQGLWVGGATIQNAETITGGAVTYTGMTDEMVIYQLIIKTDQ